jgi:hypothetical protein
VVGAEGTRLLLYFVKAVEPHLAVVAAELDGVGQAPEVARAGCRLTAATAAMLLLIRRSPEQHPLVEAAALLLHPAL